MQPQWYHRHEEGEEMPVVKMEMKMNARKLELVIFHGVYVVAVP